MKVQQTSLPEKAASKPPAQSREDGTRVQRKAREKWSKEGNSLLQQVSSGMWKKKRGAIVASRETMETFGVSSVFRKAEGVDLVEQSGNNMLSRGVSHNIQLQKDTGSKDVHGSRLVGSNDMLGLWREAGATERRKIVRDYSRNPAHEKIGRNSVDARR